MKKIRILVVGLSKSMGGIESLFINIVKFSSKNIKFDFLIFDSSCEFEKDLIEENCNIYYCTRRGTNPVKSALEQKKLFMEIGKRYDFVWNNISSASDILIYSLAKKYTDAKIISHSHGVNFESNNNLKRIIHLILHKFNTKSLIANTDYYFACSKLAGKWLFPTCSEDQIVEIKNGICVDNFKFDVSTRSLVRKNLGISDKFVLGNIGRLSKVKNQVFLIELMEQLVKENKDVMLLLIGSGEDYRLLNSMVIKKNLEQYVRFLGLRNDVNEILQAVDVFLLPSLFEGFPLSLVEAQATGLNCIISDTITLDVDLTNLVEFKKVESNLNEWKHCITTLKMDQYRSKYANKVKYCGYDIKDTVTFIERYLTEK
ncbi:glycosyltransferase [Rummeliibacillus sp. NPDC094406]|uniref:glycosyltransferase n=1 Tax=Rummeliibacillus sp. NPDC094406 TaxID=3364511 RepID=UPI0038051702